MPKNTGNGKPTTGSFRIAKNQGGSFEPVNFNSKDSFMSNFRDRAASIKAAGVAERKNFTPNGTPLKIYDYWLRVSNGTKARSLRLGGTENFCHFWRVVAIWAPLMFLSRKVESFATSTVGLVSLALIILSGIILGATASAGFLIVVLTLLGVAAFYALTFGFIYYVDTHVSRKNKLLISNVILGLLITVLAVGVLALLVWGFIEVGWILLVYLLGGVAGIMGVLMGFSALSDYISGRRALERRTREDRINNMTPEELDAFINGKTRNPSRMRKFLSSVGDFIVLAAQVVRVKKWKICPIVTVPKD